MNTSEKIKKLRLAKGMSQETLGEMVGVKKAAINKYETGRVVNIKRSTLQKLADALGVLPADLLDDPEIPHQTPVYDCAAGEGLISDGSPSEYIDTHIEADQAIARVCGRSMEPTLYDGDLVVIQAQNVPDFQGQICLVQLNGDEPTLKRVRNTEGGIVLIGDNTTVYMPHTYTAQQVRELPVTIHGVAVRLIRDL